MPSCDIQDGIHDTLTIKYELLLYEAFRVYVTVYNKKRCQ